MKKIHVLTSLTALLFSLNAFCQSPPMHAEGFFIGDDGKLFWKGGKPVYLFVSENPDGSDATRLESEKTSAYANPMYLDTEGVNYIRSQWAIDKDGNYAEPRQEVMFEMYNDGRPPKSSISFAGASKYISNDKIFYGRNLSIVVSASDRVSGVRTIMTAQNQSPFSKYTAAISPLLDEDYSLQFYAIDNVGNKEETQTFDFVVDVTNPVTTHVINGDNLREVLSPRSTLELKASDNNSGVKSTYYKVDEGAFKVYSREIALSQLSEGLHMLTYYSLDNVDNNEEHKQYAFYIDRTAPEVVATVEGDQFEAKDKIYASSRTRIKLESTDNKSGVEDIKYSINGSEENIYAGPFELPLESGEKRITFFGSDKVNNNFRTLHDQGATGNKSLSVDITAPEIKSTFLGDMCISRDTTFISSKTKISLRASDSESGVKSVTYKINGGAEQPYTKPFSVKEEGYYEVEFFGLDQVNNMSSSTFSFVNDNTGPVIETILSMEPVGSISLDEVDKSLAVYSSGVTLYLGATDGVVDTEYIYYSINDEKELLYTKPVNLAEKGITSMKVRALDKLGNETAIDPSRIFIK